MSIDALTKTLNVLSLQSCRTGYVDVKIAGSGHASPQNGVIMKGNFSYGGQLRRFPQASNAASLRHFNGGLNG